MIKLIKISKMAQVSKHNKLSEVAVIQHIVIFTVKTTIHSTWMNYKVLLTSDNGKTLALPH